MAVKNRLKDIRHDYRMNQTQFCDYLGVNRQLYNRWENQRTQPNLEWVLKISRKLSKRVEDVFYITDSE